MSRLVYAYHEFPINLIWHSFTHHAMNGAGVQVNGADDHNNYYVSDVYRYAIPGPS